MSTDIVFSFDTTGSMSPCIAEVRRNVVIAITDLFDSIEDLKIGLIAHGDYCDGDNSVNVINLTDDKAALIDFVRTVPNTGGGDSNEFYEYILHLANNVFSWNADHKSLVMIADDHPHPVGYTYQNVRYSWDWIEETHRLADKGISIYAVEALGNRYERAFYQPMAQMTNGRKLDLNQFADVVETLTAISYHASGNVGSLKAYKSHIENDMRMNRNLAAMFNALDTEAKVSSEDHSGLEPVPPYRFQILHVDYPIDIKSFVLKTGAKFLKGRGFYQFTKPEMVQEFKEVVLRNKYTGDMFTGAEAREFIGLPFGRRGTLKPHFFDQYEVFIQSTSVNRKLVGGTKFLYENEP